LTLTSALSDVVDVRIPSLAGEICRAGTPPELAVPLVRLLIRPELREVLAAPDVPALVRAAAGELLDRRPPVPDRRDDPFDPS
jgi:hypothetical protein